MNRPILLFASIIGAAALLLTATVGRAQTPPASIAPAQPRPDLRIEEATLWALAGPDLPNMKYWQRVSIVRPGGAFRICVRIRNAGGATAGAFRLSGSRVGVLPAPHLFAGLLVDQAAIRCVEYFPAPSRSGEYRATITVDSQQQVSESREDNNAMTVAVRVAP
jgi:subtilase family serine protease